MPRGGRAIDPVSASAGFCQCGYDLAPAGVKPTDLWVARHNAHHLAWLRPRGKAAPEWHALVNAQAIALDELDAYTHRLREQINERDDALADHAAMVSERDGYIAELEADLDFERRQAVMKGHQ